MNRLGSGGRRPLTLRHWWLVLLLAWMPLSAMALSFDEHARKLSLGPSLAVFEDLRGTASIADVSSPVLAASFHAHHKAVLNVGYTDSAYWLRLDLDYQPQSARGQQTWLLELAYPPLDHVDLYQEDGRGGFTLVSRSGDAWPFSQRQIKQSTYLFELQLQPGQPQRLYLRLQTEGSLQAPLTLWAPTAYLEEMPHHTYLLGIIYGVMLVMLLYNLFIYLSVRDASYFYYIFYIAAIGLYQASANGVGTQFLWPNSPEWGNAAPPFLLGATAAFGAQFVRTFLHTADFSRWMDRALKLLMAFGLLMIGLTLAIGYALPLHLAPYLALMFTVLCFSAGVMAWWRGLRQARYFLLAWSAFLLGALVYTLMSMGVLPSMFITLHASQIGAAMEVALLSLALADRINVMKEEREQILQDASAKLSALNDQLATSNRLKDEFLATITHELRTPMNGVIGALELMNTVPLESEQAQYQNIAEVSARDMLQMVNDILMLTELQAGKLQAECAPFSLQGLLTNLRQRFAERAAEKGLDFVLVLDPRLPDSVQGDAGKLGQCLSYLLDNAIKFTASGHVSLHVEGGVSGAQQVQLQIRVSDSGVGFQAAGDDQLYQHFQQLDGSLTREYGGLGIGLAICRQLLALLGGRLSHTSVLGRGSEFQLDLSLDLPGHRAPLPPAPVRPRGEPYRQPGECSLLLVEDSASNTLVLRGMLLKLGYQVRCVDSGAAALEAVRQAPVDAVLMDCQMPQVDGFAVCRALRQLPGLATLPILAITTNNPGGERERCLAAGMSDCLSKPVKFDSLQAMLHDWLLCRHT